MTQRSRGIQVKFRLSEEEAEQLKSKVEKSGMSQQEYLMKCALNKNVTNTDGLKEISIELKRIGTNLNQIAKHCNEENAVSLRTMAETRKIGEELNQVWLLLRQFLQRQA